VRSLCTALGVACTVFDDCDFKRSGDSRVRGRPKKEPEPAPKAKGKRKGKGA
jgi:hypothetical protein